ncbi:alpha/beta hydrolase [Actinomadura graeca]|uniref:Alpha/beta hydrolase n=1 Tax=Actinomadura graeca TaxID=2750812 RepID=A0ABX8RAF7_9ACTN|nr:alpha/beta hydrolase [Actinomadura graeca]QXJ26757.1 alpha/beta hydrolase [Actinomadura graeca]
METRTLKVPGATLYYEVRGSGPVLLLICGGIYDAAGYAGLAGLLADRYTVVTYDRRGNSRSPLDGPPEPQRVEVHADDASRLLAEIGNGPATRGTTLHTGPAHVFGNSSGAIIGLELAARHPEQVRTVVAHEPPFLGLLPDAGHWDDVIARVADAYAEGGAGPAMAVFGAEMGVGGDDGGEGGEEPQEEPDAETQAMLARFQKNTDFFVGYEVPPFARHRLDADALRSSGVRIVLVAGEASAGQPAHEATHAAAGRLGTKAETWPGDHGGFGSEPGAFAARLDALFAGS